MTGVCINTTLSSVAGRLTVPKSVASARWYRRWQQQLRKKTVRRRVIRGALIGSNILILAIIAFFVVQKPQTPALSTPVLANASEVSNPLDQVSSADIALTVARMGSLAESTAVTNQAQSQAADIAVAASNHNVTSKPQVVTTDLKSSADIREYTVVSGDSVSSVAARFNVTSDSIRWSNGLTGDALTVGSVILIPPVNGVIYTVNDGDTADSIAAKFRANKDKIIAYNDAELTGLRVGQRILIPEGSQASPAPARATLANIVGNSASAWGSGPMYGYNGYDYGYCTWYVANRLPVPGNWGNANTWAYYAANSGWNVSKAPKPGAVGQNLSGYYGHVAVVEAVSADGTMIKYSDMNGLAGWGREGTTADWVPASHFTNYIYR